MKIKNFIIILVLSAIVAVFGLSVSYPTVLLPKNAPVQFDGINPDSWLEDGASIKLNDLASRGDRLNIYFSSWHPANTPAPVLELSLCGNLIETFTATPGLKKTVYLTGNCQPRTLEFKSLNPIGPSVSDSRKLAVQVDKVEIGSKFGFVILDPLVLLEFTIAIFLLLTLILACSQNYIAVGLIALAATYFLADSNYPDYSNAFNLWLFSVAFFAGMVVYTNLKSNRAVQNDLRTAYQIAVDQKFSILIFVILFLAFGIRLYGLDFGFPARFHPDEVPKYNAVMRMLEHRDLNPRYFLHPSLLLYSTYFMNTVFQLTFFAAPWESSLILAGRLVSAIAGSISVYLVYKIAARLFARNTGFMAAAFLAVLPLHVTCSRYVKEDILMTAFVLLCLLAVIKAMQEDNFFWYCLAGLFAGAAASVKYTGALSVCILLTGPFLSRLGTGKSFSLLPDFKYVPWVIVACLLMPIGFLICTPYSLLDYQTFIRDFSYESAHMSRGHAVAITPWGRLWMFHFSESLIPGLTSITTLVAIAGIGFLALRRRAEDYLLIAMILLFYLPAEWVNAKPAPQPERYVVPCLPFLAIAAAEIIRMLEKRGARFTSILIFVFTLLSPAYRSIALAKEIKPDTREQLRDYLLENLPAGSRIAVDWRPYAPDLENSKFVPVYLDRARLIPSLSISNLKRLEADYLIISSLYYDRHFEPEVLAVQRQQIRNVFRKVPMVKHFSTKQGTYGFHNPSLTVFSLKAADFEKLDKELELQRSGTLELTSNQKIFRFNK